MIDLILTHLDHLWDSPLWFDALNSVPVNHFGHFENAPKWRLWWWSRWVRTISSMTTVTTLMRTTTEKTITTKRRQRLMKKKETTTTRKDMIKFHPWQYATKCFDYNFFISIWLVSKMDIHWNSNNVRICSSDEIHWNLTKVLQWTASPANVWMFET